MKLSTTITLNDDSFQVELSDEKVKNKQLEDRLGKIENEFENCKKELNTNQRLHSSLARFSIYTNIHDGWRTFKLL